MGGLEALKTVSTSYTEGSLEILGTGLKGTVKVWTKSPIMQRQEVDLTVFKETSGDNGDFAWSQDMNGKLQKVTDSTSLLRRQLSLYAADYEFLNRDSKIYKLTFDGLDTAGTATCYKITTANTLNSDTTTQFIDTATFLVVKSIAITPGGRGVSIISDYRDIGGVLYPFKDESTSYPTGMVQVFEITKMETNIAIDPTLFEPPGQDVKDYRFANGKSAENIPFEYIENHIYLNLEVGGKTRLWALDTGANMTVLMKEFTAELGLQPEGNMKGQGAGNLVDVSFVTMPPFSLPGLEFDEQKVAVIDINKLFRERMGFEVAGILGYDFLSRLVIKIDYAHELISFYEPDAFEYHGLGKVFDVELTGSEMHIPITVDGEYGGKWNLDIGAGSMAFHYPFAKEHGFLDRKGILTEGAGAGGTTKSNTVLFKTVEFGGVTVNNLTFSMPLETPKGGFGSGEITGNAGNTLFEHFVMYLDYKDRQIILEKGADFDKVFPRNGSGMIILNDDGHYVLGFISPGSPADKAGLMSDDVILNINGIATEYFDGLVAIYKLMEEPPGTEYRLTVKRSDATKEVKLKLQDLYK